MKKLILTLATVAFIGIGGSAASAATPSQLPEGCDEPSNIPSDPCYDARLYPIVTPPPATTTTTTTTIPDEIEILPPETTTTTTTIAVVLPPGELPRTGSGISPVLGIGALLLIGGGIVVIASRRRSTAAPSS